MSREKARRMDRLEARMGSEDGEPKDSSQGFP